MSSSKRSSILIGSIVIIGMGLATPAAQAFDPQPDPPARIKNSDKTWNYNKRNVQPGDPGLLNNGSGFSTQTPSPAGTPIGGARGGATGIR
jgi:hypothetical protein